MNMNLKMVTFETDLTQFLVNADNKLEAIKYAVEANLKLGDVDDDPSCIHNLNNYTVADIDFEMLREIVKRTDYLFSTEHAIVYND